MSMHGMHNVWPGVPPAVKALRIAGLVVLGVIGAAAFALVFGWLVMILWNWLMPAIFHLGVLTYWQAVGIVVLAKLIFGGIGGGSHGGRGRAPWKGSHRDRAGGARDEWRWYREFWDEEGREAFDKFVQKKSTAPGAENAPPTA
jgi:hypothetical protein